MLLYTEPGFILIQHLLFCFCHLRHFVQSYEGSDILSCIHSTQRAEQKVSKIATVILVATWLFGLVTLFVTIANKITWLQYLYYFSYIKLAITLIKYIPQVSGEESAGHGIQWEKVAGFSLVRHC